MATGETNFAVGGRKTWKRDRTPPAEGEQVLILRTDGDKAKVAKYDNTLPIAKCMAQVKGSGLDGAPDKWIFLTFWLDLDGDRPGVYAADGIDSLAQALGERSIEARVMTSTHPKRKEPAQHLSAEDVAAWLRARNKREVKVILAHKKRHDVKTAKKPEDYEAFVDMYVVDASFNPSSPDDVAPEPEPREPEAMGEASAEQDDHADDGNTNDPDPEQEAPAEEAPKKVEPKKPVGKNSSRKR